MKANPGGGLDPTDVVGRDGLVAELWEILQQQSVYINDLRRMGKTQLMVKMEAAPPPKWIVIKRDLEGLHSAEEFATQIYQDVLKALPGAANLLASMGALLGKARGLEIAGVIKLPDQSNAPWKEVFNRTLTDLNDHMVREDKFAVLMWDEVPYLLDNVGKSSPATAGEILDAIRAASQQLPRIRFLLTGSIGLHHTLTQLKKSGYSGSPLNHMRSKRVGPLSVEQGRVLALALLQGESINTAGQHEGIAEWIAEAVGHVPYYIHKLVSVLPRGDVVREETLAQLLNAELNSTSNDWDFEHYRTRIDHHFGERAAVALAVLDSLALAEVLSFGDLEQAVRSRTGAETELIREVLLLLCKDHYLVKDDGRYAFYLQMVRRWWLISRDLDGDGE